MSNGQDTGSTDNVEESEPRDLPGGDRKGFRLDHLNVNIREAESHYLVSFNHGPTRVFHNVQELLVAIEVGTKRLGGTLGGG